MQKKSFQIRKNLIVRRKMWLENLKLKISWKWHLLRKMNFFHEGSFSKREKLKLKLQREILKHLFLKEKSLLVRLIKRGKINGKSLLLPQLE
jgi:hypothetical protein